ncbi:MAG: hypothetical protein IIW71_03845 [Treponema sp.]|nr:hypothetical protein [Treponema sp.]
MKKYKKIIDFFSSENESFSDEKEEDLIFTRIKSFIFNFSKQTIKYKIVWIVRILCWLLFIILGIIGTFL